MSRSDTPGGEPPYRRQRGDEWDAPAQPEAERHYGRSPYRQPERGAGGAGGFGPGFDARGSQPRGAPSQSRQRPPQPGIAPQFQPMPAAPAHSPRPGGKRSQRGVWIALLVVIVLLAIGGGGVVAYASVQASAAAQAAQRYCAALLADDYGAAYDTLTPALQAQAPRDQFVADGKLHDQIDGRVTQCAAHDTASGPLGSVSHIGSTSLTLNATIRRAVVYTGAMTVTKQGGGWKIAIIATSLQGIDLGPLKTGQAFCAALVTTHYAAAYALLSHGQQSQVSEQQFAAQFSDTFSGSPIRLAGCDLDLATYFVNGTTAKVTMRLTINNPQASSGLLNVALTIVREAGAWKIDDIHLTN